MSQEFSRPGRDRRAVRHAGPVGALQPDRPRVVNVVGGGIAGLAAATALVERGVQVRLFEANDRLGGRVAAWPLPDGRTMSRGFHAFFRQYYNLRGLLRRVDPELSFLVPIDDYPLQRPDGMRDSFTGLAKTPPWSVMQFVARSPAFTAKTLAQVHLPSALELMRVRFPETFTDHDGESAAQFLDRLRFPAGARDLALEVFARSFFADPRKFGAGELVAMFHAYFIGSAEGLLFDVPNDDYDTVLWGPLGEYLTRQGVEIHTGSAVERIDLAAAEATVLATDPRTSRGLIADLALPDGVDAAEFAAWQRAVADTVNAPPFVVVRLWLDRPVAADRPAFLGTSGYGPLDNVSVLERFEAGAARWAGAHGGSVVELHAYACENGTDQVTDELVRQLHLIWPETATAGEMHREVLIEDDCGLVGPTRWNDRPGVSTPVPGLVLAGDWVRCDWPVALMERATTTGVLAANELLGGWSVQGHDLWTVPMQGLLARTRRR